jgi:ATP-binding cassette subfamily F protein 3
MIILRNISLRRGSKILLDDASLTVQPGYKLALVGANGCGKSSLFALLTGELAVDHGTLEGLETLRIATMAQEVAASGESALDYLIGGNAEVATIRTRLQLAEARGDFEAAGVLHNQLEAADGYGAERDAAALLRGLGFAEEDQPRPVNDFSGGWRIRLNLGRALMCPSDVLLLDEPTNHLDLDATLWLQQWLQSYRGTLVIISHDRDFIDASCQNVVHIEAQQLNSYRGNYSSFEQQRAERLALQQASFEKQQRRIAEIDQFVRRFRYKATKAKQAQSRLKELERMEKIAPAHVDSPFNFRFPEPEKASDPVLALREAELGYGDLRVLQAVDITLRPGSRVGLLGRNGAGKSTLLKSLTGKLALLRGERLQGQHCAIGYFDQHQLEALDLQASAQLHLQRLSPGAREQEILNFLGGFNFRGDMATETIAPFSGGEKARLALAITVWQKPNLLIMDEPTNHLDLEMCHALTMALQGFEGALVLVTHDRHLLRNTVDELLLVHDGRVDEYDGDMESYEQWVLQQTSAANKNLARDNDERGEDSSERSGNRKQQRQQAARQREQLKPLRKAINRAEKQLESNSLRLDRLEEQLADGELYHEERKDELAQLVMEQGTLRSESSKLEDEWLELTQQLEQLETDKA